MKSGVVDLNNSPKVNADIFEEIIENLLSPNIFMSHFKMALLWKSENVMSRDLLRHSHQTNRTFLGELFILHSFSRDAFCLTEKSSHFIHLKVKQAFAQLFLFS